MEVFFKKHLKYLVLTIKFQTSEYNFLFCISMIHKTQKQRASNRLDFVCLFPHKGMGPTRMHLF